MQRCIQLASNGLGSTYPNPMVGSVIVHDSKIIGEGWHEQAGKPHAEVNAITSVEDESLLKESTIYVSLEPCSHFGKTPPCSDLIIEKQIPKVVVGTTDPHSKVAGQGIARLRKAGCEVEVGILESECQELNKRFFTFHQKKRPFVILKWAQTADGFIAPVVRPEKAPVWITNEFSRQRVHKMRSEEQAILVGTKTVLMDNPKLTNRDWSGNSPLRVVLDRDLKIPQDANVFDGSAPTLVLTENPQFDQPNLRFATLDFSVNLAEQICETLYKHGVQSVIVEGGTMTLQTFIDAGLWDEAYIFEGHGAFGEGVPAPKLETEFESEENIAGDILRHFKNQTS